MFGLCGKGGTYLYDAGEGVWGRCVVTDSQLSQFPFCVSAEPTLAKAIGTEGLTLRVR